MNLNCRSDLSYAFQASDITSQLMKSAIEDWHNMYYQKVPTEKEDPCQQIPYTIVRKLTKTAFSEYRHPVKISLHRPCWTL